MPDEERRRQHDAVDSAIARLLSSYDPRKTPPRELWSAQYDLGLAWVHFPEGLGGLGVRQELQHTVDERLAAAGIFPPSTVNPIGVGWVGPTLLAHGTEAQKTGYLKPCFCCDEIWCQLFSEPGAGSDLANVATMAERHGDEWIIKGQKVWTSLALDASRGLLLARTDLNQPKHKGMTCFVVDMQAEGIEVNPIRQLDGGAHFCEVFLTDVRVPDAERVGNPGAGWRTAIDMLKNERTTLGRVASQEELRTPITAAREAWTRRPLGQDMGRRDLLLQLWIRGRAHQLTVSRSEALTAAGLAGLDGSISKLTAAELEQDTCDYAVSVLGPSGMLYPGFGLEAGKVERRKSDPAALFLVSTQATIAGGTSEILRNALAERVLGLPAEPRTDKGVPWIDSRRA